MARKLLYVPACVEAYRRALQQAREDLHEMDLKHRAAMADLYAELDQCRCEIEKLKDIVRERHAAEQRVALLQRDRDRFVIDQAGGVFWVH